MFGDRLLPYHVLLKNEETHVKGYGQVSYITPKPADPGFPTAPLVSLLPYFNSTF